MFLRSIVLFILCFYFNNIKANNFNTLHKTTNYNNSICCNKLKVTFNKNISTYSIVERLTAAHKGRLFWIDGKKKFTHLPMVRKAYLKYSKNQNTKIIKSTLKYLSIVGNQQDYTYQALIHHNTFPKKGYKYPLTDLNLDDKKLTALKIYIEDLRLFFIENNINTFFTENKSFIRGGIKEFKKNSPNKYYKELENYYGTKLYKYKVYLDPFNTLPLDEKDNDFFHGNGSKIKTKKGEIACIVSSPYLPIYSEKTNKYGFDHPDYVKLILTHEFGHSFINDNVFDIDLEALDIKNIFTQKILEKMKPQGYGNWKICLIEHIVRLGEIRIAENLGDKQRAELLRKEHINRYHFKYISFLEKAIEEYENNRDKYPSYKDFLPKLLKSLHNVKN